MAEEPNEELSANHTVLAVFPAAEDRAVLGSIFACSHWTLRAADTVVEARQALHASSIGVVISEGRFPDGLCWKDLLWVMRDIRNPPPLIVADRFADERLWAEVLNLGGQDLLMKPFDAREVLYAVGLACRSRENQEVSALPRKQPKAAAESGAPPEGKRMARV